MRRLFYQDDVYLYNHDAQQLYKQQQHDCHATRGGVGNDDDDDDDDGGDFGIHPKYLRNEYLQVFVPQVFVPGIIIIIIIK